MYRTALYILSLLSLTACAYDDDTAVVAPVAGDGAISFANAVAPFTRAEKTGKEAADLLGGHFHVFAIKNEDADGAGNLTAENLVFNNYKVTYTDGSQGTSATNPAGWDYVGETLTANEAANIQSNSGTEAQLIKYWDYNASDYTFYAFAMANNNIDEGKIKVEKVTNYKNDVYQNGYTVTLTADADPTKLYLANRQHITASANQDPTQTNAYGGKVNFSFRNAMAKVRVGMYETIPGYSLTLDAFRIADASATPSFGDMTTEQTTSFAANLANAKPGTAGSFTVIYKDQQTTEENVPAVLFNGTRANVLTLGDNLKQGTQLGEDAANVVYDQAGGAYTPVYPMEGNVSNLKLKVDFTLTAKTGETIKVKNATAEVPASFLKWRPGYAYTYLFKISDQTNAAIGSLTGLYPITFDALAIVDGTGKEEEISTTGTEANIVTMGYDPDTKSIVVNADDYHVGNTVYASFVGSSTVVAPTASNAKLYVVTTDDADNYPVTESNVADYLVAFASDATLVDQHITAYAQTLAAGNFVSQVPQGDGTDDMRSLTAVKWTAGRHVYAVEYTAASGTKHYKVVKADGYNGLTEGTLALSPSVFTNVGGSIAPTLTVDGVTPSNAEVSYTLDYAGTYGTAVPAAVTVEDNLLSDGVRIVIPANTAADTKYTVIATYNRRTYKATFTVNQ